MFKHIFAQIDNENNFKKVAEKQLKNNMAVIQSLRDYDEGKKDISTRDLERSLPGIRVTS